MTFTVVESIGDFIIPAYSISSEEAEELPKVSHLSPVQRTSNSVQSCVVSTVDDREIHLHTTEWHNKEYFLMEVKHQDSLRFFLCKNILISGVIRKDELSMTIILPEHQHDRSQRTTYRIPNISGVNQGLEFFFETQPEITKMCLSENGYYRMYVSLYQLGTFERFGMFLRDTA